MSTPYVTSSLAAEISHHAAVAHDNRLAERYTLMKMDDQATFIAWDADLQKHLRNSRLGKIINALVADESAYVPYKSKAGASPVGTGATPKANAKAKAAAASSSAVTTQPYTDTAYKAWLKD